LFLESFSVLKVVYRFHLKFALSVITVEHGVHRAFYTLAGGILILVRRLQRSEGDVSDPVKYIYS